MYRINDVKMISLRGYSPDEELSKVAEVRKLFCGGGSYFSWSSLGPNHAMTDAAAVLAARRDDARDATLCPQACCLQCW